MAAIDVGSPAIDRSGVQGLYNSALPSYFTAIDYNNAANDTGTITSVKAWFQTAVAGNSVKVGTFADGGGGTFTCHDAESIGEVTAGSEQTYSGLSIDINTGEFIGADARTAFNVNLEKAASGGAGVYFVLGQQYCDPTDSGSFTLTADDILSLNGIGATAGGGTAVPVFTYYALHMR